jgi:hypothetical protein
LLSKAYRGEDFKNSSALEWYIHFNEISHIEISNEGNTHHLLQYLGYCSLLINYTRLNSRPGLLCGNTEAVA